jgi:uncharacterized protein
VTLPPTARRKLLRLRSGLSALGNVLVAFSGGTDSTLLLRVAAEELGPGVLAVTASSDIYPSREVAATRRLARSFGVRWRVIKTAELRNAAFRGNPPLRCYYCKKELFKTLRRIARAEGIRWVLDGSNADDGADYRPGARAGAALGVRSPLKDAGLTKAEIRLISRSLGLPNWDKPALACLASRFPYHHPIDEASLRRVGRAEDYLRRLGFKLFRVRHHGDVARIELDAADIGRALDRGLRRRISRRLKALGYTYVSLDLDGYRTGSMNETLARTAPGRKSASAR